MDYTKILPSLFLGSHPQAIDDIDRLRLKAGITAVISLQTDDDMHAVDLTWEPLEAHYKASGIELCRVPVRDFDPIDLQAKLPACVRALDRLFASGHTVYLHCTAGTGRSPAVATAYLHWCLGWDLDQGVAYVKQRRECVPNAEAIRQASWSSVN